jgi:hypothetical protein
VDNPFDEIPIESEYHKKMKSRIQNNVEGIDIYPRNKSKNHQKKVSKDLLNDYEAYDRL